MGGNWRVYGARGAHSDELAVVGVSDQTPVCVMLGVLLLPRAITCCRCGGAHFDELVGVSDQMPMCVMFGDLLLPRGSKCCGSGPCRAGVLRLEGHSHYVQGVCWDPHG
jgi:hypothetical protein